MSAKAMPRPFPILRSTVKPALRRFEFASPIYWLAVILSISVAPVGAAIALTLANRALGISALIGENDDE